MIHSAQMTAIRTANGYTRPASTKARASTTKASIRQPATLRRQGSLITGRSACARMWPGAIRTAVIACRHGAATQARVLKWRTGVYRSRAAACGPIIAICLREWLTVGDDGGTLCMARTRPEALIHCVVQSVLTGTIRPNAVQKLRAFGLDGFFDFEIGGYGSEIYPKGAQLMMSRSRAAEKYGVPFGEASTVYIGDSTRDVEAARVGGARSVAIATGRSTEGDLRAAGADLVLPDLTEISAVIRAIQLLTMPSA